MYHQANKLRIHRAVLWVVSLTHVPVLPTKTNIIMSADIIKIYLTFKPFYTPPLFPITIASMAKKKIKSMKMNGRRTRNQEMPVCPLRHKKSRNHVQRKMKKPFTAKEPRERVVTMEISAITESTK